MLIEVPMPNQMVLQTLPMESYEYVIPFPI